MVAKKTEAEEAALEALKTGGAVIVHEHKNIHEAILGVMGEVGYVQKQSSPQLGYKFAGEAALIAALRPAMIEHGITMHVVDVSEVALRQITARSGNVLHIVSLTVKVRFTHAASASFIETSARSAGMDSGDKNEHKALTGAYKYCLRQTFVIETGDDPDKHASPEDGDATEKRDSGAQGAAGDASGSGTPQDSPKAVDCPDCGAPMIKKTAQKGPNAGGQFYGCSKYPKCRKTLDVSVVEASAGTDEEQQQKIWKAQNRRIRAMKPKGMTAEQYDTFIHRVAATKYPEHVDEDGNVSLKALSYKEITEVGNELHENFKASKEAAGEGA